MTVPLPQPIPTASQWKPVDFLRTRASTTPAAGGVATVELPQLADDELWVIGRSVVSCSSSTKTTLRFYESSVSPGRYLSGSIAGNFDEAEYPGVGGLQIAPATSLVAQWTGASNGAVGQLALQGMRYRRA